MLSQRDVWSIPTLHLPCSTVEPLSESPTPNISVPHRQACCYHLSLALGCHSYLYQWVERLQNGAAEATASVPWGVSIGQTFVEYLLFANWYGDE